MRVVCGFVLAIVVGCGSEGVHAGPPDAQLTFFPMWIVVTDGGVAMYTNGADFGDCTCTALRFPDVGTCSFISDAGPCPGQCLSCIRRFDVEVNGQSDSSVVNGEDPWATAFTQVPGSSLTLVLEGCGHPTTRIPLDGPAFPEATAMADYVGGKPHVSWTEDASATSTLVTLQGGLHGEFCNLSGTEYTFDDWDFAYWAAVAPLAAPTSVETNFGPATVWRAGGASAQFPN